MSAKITTAQRALYEGMLRSGDVVEFSTLLKGRSTVTIPSYPGRVTHWMIRCLQKAGLVRCAFVKPGEMLPQGGVNELRTPRYIYVAVSDAVKPDDAAAPSNPAKKEGA